jgi:hypothetical protein
MRASRAPEGRNTKNQFAFWGVGLGVIAAAVVVAFFLFGSDSISAKDDQPVKTQDAPVKAPSAVSQPASQDPAPLPQATAILAPTAIPEPKVAPSPAETPAPIAQAKPLVEKKAATEPQVYPEAQFGEVLEEGLVDLRLPQGELVKTWYSFQVDTDTRNITLFFAQYDDAFERILSTVRIEDYTWDNDLDNAEVVFNYPNGSTRTLVFDAAEGSISLNQQYVLPVGPSMFSSDLRRGLVYYAMQLQDNSGDIEVELHLDLSGLSQSEGLEFKRLAPRTVEAVLQEIQYLVEKIEDSREQS